MNEVTRILNSYSPEDPKAAEELLPLVRTELHRLARNAMAGQPSGHTLQPTALVNEAWLKLAGLGAIEGREHFLALAAAAMRSVLVDHARRRRAAKRGGGAQREALEGLVLEYEERAIDLVALDEALTELAEVEPRGARIVELRFFGGLDHPAIAQLLDRSLRSVERDWATARAWLRHRLRAGEGG